MAADSRVTFEHGDGTRTCRDYDNYLKVIKYNDVLYGFAGTNNYFQKFLELLLTSSLSDMQILDALTSAANRNKHDFLVLRYEDELRCFGYIVKENSLYDSSVEPLNVESYGIGSGATTTIYKKHSEHRLPSFPIRKIIDKNSAAIAKAKKKESQKVAKMKKQGLRNVNPQAIDCAYVCAKAGGDYGTGGVIKMTDMQLERDVVQAQIGVLAGISQDAKSSNAVAVCSFDAKTEKEKLDSLGVHARETDVTFTEEEELLVQELTQSLSASDKEESEDAKSS